MAVSPRQVQLSWSPPPPELTNGVITGYTVTVTGIESDESYTIDTVATQYSVTTLPYTSYMFSVSASTERGVGPPSPEVVIETPEEGKKTSCPTCMYQRCVQVKSIHNFN